ASAVRGRRGRPGRRGGFEVSEPGRQVLVRSGQQQRESEHLNSGLPRPFYPRAWPNATAVRRRCCSLDAPGARPQKECACADSLSPSCSPPLDASTAPPRPSATRTRCGPSTSSSAGRRTPSPGLRIARLTSRAGGRRIAPAALPVPRPFLASAARLVAANPELTRELDRLAPDDAAQIRARLADVNREKEEAKRAEPAAAPSPAPPA